MASFGSDPARNFPPRGLESAKSEPAASRNLDLGQLDRVLESTLAQLSRQHGEISPELTELAKQRRDAGFGPQIADALVQAVLRADWQEIAGGPAAFEDLCRQISQTLFDDPVAHSRLRNMWSKLVKAQP